MNQDELGKGKQWIQKILQSYLNLGPRSKSEVGKEFFLYFCLGSESGRGAGHGFGLPPTWASWDQGMFLLLARILWTISGDAQRTPCWHLIPLPIEGPQKQGPGNQAGPIWRGPWIQIIALGFGLASLHNWGLPARKMNSSLSSSTI